MMKTAVFACVTSLLVPNLCLADETQQAVELLATSLKCPVKAYYTHGNDDGHFDSSINTYIGSPSKFAISMEGRQDNDRVDSSVRISANYSALQLAEAIESPFESFSDGTSAFDVRITCMNGSDCIEETGTDFGPDHEYDFIVCDKDTADNITLAINTLIKLNK